MNWWQYLLLVNVYLVLFYGFYALLLRKETFFQLNRLYLVSAALLSFFIPLIQSDWVKSLFITQKVQYTLYGSPVMIYQFKPVEEAPVNIGQLLAVLYLAGVVFLTLRLVWQLILLNKIIKQPEQAAAYSFFKKVRIGAAHADSDVISAHEQVHVKQWHSADVLIIEVVMIINWFNPVVYFYRRAIKHIHEFIADRQVLKTANNKADYALLLISQTFNLPSRQLANNFFNHSLLKQRIIMLQKSKSQRIALIKYGLSAPLFMLMLILSSATVNNSKAVKIVNKKAEQVFLTPAVINAAGNNDVHLQSNTITAPIQKVEQKNTNLKEALSNKPDTTPTFPGPGSFDNFLQRELRYPATARIDNVEGKVIVAFIVEKDGSISNVKALRGPSLSLDAEVVRCVKLSPKWNPGYQNGKAVRAQFTVPINFSLNNQDTNELVSGAVIDNDIQKPVHGLDEIHIVGLASKPDTGKTFTPTFTGKIKVNGKMVTPLIIVDGKEMSNADMRMIPVGNIESITVLNDKSAIAPYGAKGKNGVLIITTKKK